MENSALKDKKILIAISGGIAVYKVCELVRLLIKEKAIVRIVMSESATQFVSPLTFETLSGHEVAYKMFPENQFIGTRHIDWADWADLMLFAPATSNCIAKLAHGFTDDLLSTIASAFNGPKIIAPAMNSNMWRNPALQNNLKICNEFGYRFVPPEEGDLACGWVGEGRLAPLHHIRQHLLRAISPAKLSQKRVLISLGPSIEDIDPVRYLSNRSSGKMGIALANAAWAMGAELTIIHGPIHLTLPKEAKLIPVRSADDFLRETQRAFLETDVFISTAAIADFRPKKKSAQKIKKNGDKDFDLELKRTDDVLASLKKRRDQVVIGFALETNDGYENAKKKLKDKDLDYIVLNVPNLQNTGFEHDTNHGIVISRTDEIELSVKTKELLAFELLNIIFP